MKQIIFLIVLLSFFSCTNETIVNPTKSDDSFSDVTLYFNKTETVKDLVTTAEAIVSAPDMDTLKFTLFVSEESVEGTLTEIPAGEKRKIEIFCYDENQKLTYEGSSFVDVVAGKTSLVEMILYPVTATGDVIVVGSFSPYPRPEGLVVFQADYNGSFDIYRIQVDGTGIKQLTHSEYNDYEPRISPDRSKIVFVRVIEGMYRPYLINIDGSNEMPLNLPQDYSIPFCSWSPDGTRLVYHAKKNGEEDRNIFIYDFISKEVTQIVFEEGYDWRPKFSPDGEQIIFYSNRTGIFKIYTVNTDGSNVKLLMNQEGFEERVPEYSPGGDQVVLAGRYYGDWGIYLVDSNGDNFVKVIDEDMDENIPSFSPDGQKIIFQRKTYENGNGIYTMDKSGNNLKKILDTEYNEQSAHWR